MICARLASSAARNSSTSPAARARGVTVRGAFGAAFFSAAFAADFFTADRFGAALFAAAPRTDFFADLTGLTPDFRAVVAAPFDPRPVLAAFAAAARERFFAVFDFEDAEDDDFFARVAEARFAPFALAVEVPFLAAARDFFATRALSRRAGRKR